jgi:putative transposase
LPSSTALVVGSTDSESIRLRSKKIRVYPEKALDLLWKKWSAATRYCYNQAIAQQRVATKRLSKLSLRNLVMNLELPQWIKDTPCHIRQNAIFDAHLAYTASRDAKFRSIRNPTQTIKFNGSNFSKGTWYSRLTKGLTWLASEPTPVSSEYGTQLVKQKDRWYAIFPEIANSITTYGSGSIIALDPGVRTFLTGFDGHRFTQFGGGDFSKIARLCRCLDKLQSRIAKAKCKLKRRLRMASFRLRQRIRNLVDELHKQVACYLTHNYKVILLPTFETSNMVAKVKRRIGSKTARTMLTWAHYRFKQTLKHQAELRSCEVVEVSEAYTSKTCTKCGQVHTKLGGSKIFKCPNCGHCIDRDFNGALGIMLRALRDISTTLSSAIIDP